MGGVLSSDVAPCRGGRERGISYTVKDLAMKCRYSASFEYDTRPVTTTKGEVIASQVATCFARAARKAAVDQKPKGWRSVVVVLERMD